MEKELNVSPMTTLRELHEQLLYPHHLQRVWGLMPVDFPARENFRRCFLQRSADYIFVPSVPFTDESYFGTDGIIGIHNQHQWAEENHYGVIEKQFSINMWPEIVGDV
jgi:hypothetical protein